MSAPAHTARIAPSGNRLDDGFSTIIAFEADPDIKFWEKAVTPPGFDGGDAIPTSTMHNETLRTFAAAALSTMTDASIRVAYDPAVYPQIRALINVEGAITVHFPAGDKLSFFGFLRTFEPDELAEGAQPEATISITCTNQDPVTGDEEDPVYGT
jgi:hypothetical protein